MKKVNRNAADQNSVRLVAGRWRGRRIRFPDGEGLRPTPARLRETLFNWLMHDVRDARVLDLFAGSGALAFEALSRGARSALLVDASPAVCAQLTRELAQLAGADARVQRGDALALLRQPPAATFDLVFLDPPFHQELPAQAIPLLEQSGLLADQAWIYVEAEQDPAAVPANWRLHRRSQAGQSCGLLYRREAA